MVLGSQAPRSGGNAARTKRRGRGGGGRKLKVALVLGALGAGAYWYTTSGGEPQVVMPEADPSGVAQASPDRSSAQPVADTPQQQTPQTGWRISEQAASQQASEQAAAKQASGQQATAAQTPAPAPAQQPARRIGQQRTTPSPVDVSPAPEPTPRRSAAAAAFTSSQASAKPAASPQPAPQRDFTQAIEQVVGLQSSNFAAFTDEGPSNLRADLATTLSGGMKMIETGEWVQGRRVLSDLLREHELHLPAADAQAIRDVLMSVNQKMFFSRQVFQGDPLAEEYTIKSGDLMDKIARRYDVTFELLGQINNMNPNRIRAGQRIKVVRGPLHAVVDKSAFRMDIYSTADGGKPLYVTSFVVGCGEDNSTPVGNFVVSDNGKIPNPAWANPRTGERFSADDPKNPIGEYWLGLTGTDDQTRTLRGYGIHGTIVPESIGKNMSMGCVRLLPDEIKMVYSLLVPAKSTVLIRP